MKISPSQKAKAFLVFTVLLFAFTTSYTQVPGSGWNLVFSDEFNGNSVDQNKWSIRTNGVFRTNQLRVNNGTLKINNTYSSNGNIAGGWIGSKTRYTGNNKFGYYEARVRITGNTNGAIWPTW